jgi:hypothetical protein
MTWWLDVGIDAILVIGTVASVIASRRDTSGASDVSRCRALAVCDRLEREGRGLRGATPEELKTIKRGLEF